MEKLKTRKALNFLRKVQQKRLSWPIKTIAFYMASTLPHLVGVLRFSTLFPGLPHNGSNLPHFKIFSNTNLCKAKIIACNFTIIQSKHHEHKKYSWWTQTLSSRCLYLLLFWRENLYICRQSIVDRLAYKKHASYNMLSCRENLCFCLSTKVT